MTGGLVSMGRLKARLSAYLARVRAGGVVVVTDRGKPVARIEPPSAADDPQGDLAALVDAGLARPPARPLPEDFFTSPRPADPGGAVLKALLARRGENDV